MAHALDLDPLALREKIDTNDTDDARARKVEGALERTSLSWSQRRPPGCRVRVRSSAAWALRNPSGRTSFMRHDDLRSSDPR